MREILFRGKSTDSGEWMYGAYSPYYWDIIGERENNPQIIIFDEKTDNDGLWAEVIPETVGQYTGLADKNGKKIFEGDIVLDKYQCEKSGLVGVVKYIAERSQFEFILKEHPDYVCNLGSRINSIKIIGNIHDNPELLEVKE